MANTFLKAETIIGAGLGLLRRQLILPRLVTRLGRADFQGAQNDTVNVRVPARTVAREYEWRTRTNPIVFDELQEFTVPVALDRHPYSAVAVTDEELTLDIRSFGEQVLQPQTLAVAEALEGYIATAMDAASYGPNNHLTWDPADPFGVLVEARKLLNQENVPTMGRVAVLGANLEADILNDDLFKRVDASGSDDVLREATIGRAAGFTVIGNVNSIDPDSAYAFHPTAYAFANLAPDVPDGAVAGAGAVFDGLAMRWIRDYDANFMRDRSVVSAFAGAASVDDGRDANGALTDQNVRAVKITVAGPGV